MNNRFECCFEDESKGIYFTVEDHPSFISIAMHNGGEVETEVCIRREEGKKLVDLLKSFLLLHDTELSEVT